MQSCLAGLRMINIITQPGRFSGEVVKVYTTHLFWSTDLENTDQVRLSLQHAQISVIFRTVETL